MKRYLTVFLFLFAHYGFAQIGWKGELPVVEESDYYNLELNRELIGAGLKYLKIMDEHDNEVPYFIRSSDPIKEISNFENFDLVSNATKDSLNIIVVDNRRAEYLNRFCVILRQAETRKYASVRGSNDSKQWYVVKQETSVSGSAKQTNESTEMLIIDFPQGNYKYYEITLWNDQKSPLNVLNVGKIKNSNIYGNFSPIDLGITVIKNDRNNKTTCLLFPELKYTYCIDKIEFGIKNKPDYYRRVIITDSISYNEDFFYISSKNENSVLINDFFFTPHSQIVIENLDNPPLVIDSVKFYGLNRYACLYLEAGKKYRLALNREGTVSLEYDIEHFRNEIPADIFVLKVKNLQPIPDKVVPKREPTLLERPVFLWGVIIIIGAFLVFICFLMIREMKKKKN